MRHASTPPTGTPVPPSITLWAQDNAYDVDELVWINELGGLTARLVRDERPTVYAKWAPYDMIDEAERLSWLHGRFPSPAMADYVEVDDGSVIVTFEMAGRSAVSDRWKSEPDVAARAIGEGLARLHALDSASCMFDAPDWITDDVGNHVVVLHGDPCAPNTLLDDAGAFAGIVDVGDLGPGDPWADLAIASWSLEWNFGPGHESAFWEAYGITPDEDRIAHYRQQWDAANS